MKVRQLLELKGNSVIALRPSSTFADAIHCLALERIGLVAVTDDDGTLRGVVSERDIIRVLAEGHEDSNSISVSSFMTRSVITCGRDDAVMYAMERMNTHGRDTRTVVGHVGLWIRRFGRETSNRTGNAHIVRCLSGKQCRLRAIAHV